MPEGPEIRRAADRLSTAVVGKPIGAIWFAFPSLKLYEKKLRGKRIEAITPHGKALLIRFEGGLTLYSHNQLYGVWKIVGAGERPTSSRSLRVAIDTARKSILLYSASDVSIWPSDQIAMHPFLRKLGPDVLDPNLTADQVGARLLDGRFKKRSLASLLLDQSFLAGMGNYLRSEALFAAALRPQQRPSDLSDRERANLAAALLDVPRRSYETRGIRSASGMKSDYIVDTPEGFRFAVFGRQEQPCFHCATPIARIEAAGRRLYLCPTCQAATDT